METTYKYFLLLLFSKKKSSLKMTILAETFTGCEKKNIMKSFLTLTFRYGNTLLIIYHLLITQPLLRAHCHLINSVSSNCMVILKWVVTINMRVVEINNNSSHSKQEWELFSVFLYIFF